MGDRLIQKRSSAGLSRKSLMVQHYNSYARVWLYVARTRNARKSLGNSMVSGFLSLVRNAKSVKDSFGAKESFPPPRLAWERKNSLHLLTCIVSRRKNSFAMRTARDTRQLGIFPLATTTVGWVPDRTPGGPKRSGGCDPFPRNDSLSQGLGTWTNTALVFDNLVSVQVKFLSP